MVYFKIDLSTIVAGSTHQTVNLILLIRYCFANNLKLIKPIFRLCGSHNNNNEMITDLSGYYDLDAITVDGNSFRIYDDNNYTYTIERKTYVDHLLSNDPIFKNVKRANVVIPYKQDIIDRAEKVLHELGEYMCIHVRRGDRITNNQIDIDTQPDNIIKVINHHNPKNVYIMTNKLNELKSLSNIENIFFYTDFEFLNIINDNYYLFCIENIIMKFANIRCSTFNVKLENKNDSYYHCYLSNNPGWQ